ncbi:uncharacterized protein SEPMUDRAFT_145529 [Sphaerulina musiva SO2202]|uniref:Transmembrane protein n=1 Tax=Sphaerulina musiva (strain SO2202) TaxID=692275 RepID=N1QLU9_SPHMS|nr:uncharacterized protein SEPMUDRAFT_145529 [Sphaerulina musiva SO2202]EMF16214.1 hypothetical protein SEPMUDRAFT_145529 [Sphaerulina musiva SO2202]
MSSDSLAVFRKGFGPDLNELAEKHMQHDLTSSDRDALKNAASTVSLHATLGSALGIALSVLLAYRIRSGRKAMFRTFRTAEKPSAVRFADGREEVLPDLTPLLRPSRAGDVATFGFLGLGGLFVGGELGLLSGSLQARRSINQDGESRERIRNAFLRFQADALRKEAEALEKNVTSGGMGGIWK